MLEPITFQELRHEFVDKWQKEIEINPNCDADLIISPNGRLSISRRLLLYNFTVPPQSNGESYLTIESENQYLQLKIGRENAILVINECLAIKYA